ncbi:MAG: TatD family hydrolase, partial [Treponema sp.]|nr:TatD family hydrolase [Treponema sp.]
MTDAHCHLWDLRDYILDAEGERRKCGTAVAVSSCTLEEFLYHEGLAKKAREEKEAPVFCCFALHPQLSPDFLEIKDDAPVSLEAGLGLLESLAGEGRL